VAQSLVSVCGGDATATTAINAAAACRLALTS
jgi:hypothetical protein